jgi:hypothetical protein
MAKSVGGATRGFHPDVVLCDDILWGTTGTELQRAADWFYGVLLPVLHHTGRLMMVGTPFSYNDLYAELEQTRDIHKSRPIRPFCPEGEATVAGAMAA